ncbi:alpha/beta hydrolase [Streptomyces sp. AV19]|uniref:alpha/beta fold hydrolase n=1 Tax=Streptomyces sp. AV19 TaxID=2793068 RepID=UPI0018FF10D4|nr:alpha/beta hydrolase [Streptomyces sp. AV19]MBH1934766.1 alpha/beta hydrolase [Streptomyces sp. AV19]MDG4530627.1 alpha/beta hydrolase [Streptomyces sp. AV19]
MATIVLVPGFWLGAWAWEEVARPLREAGHDVHPLTLTGLAERAGEAGPGVDVETHVADIVRTLEEKDLREVVLVGHSGANLPVTGAADRVPERVARVVYVDSGPLPGGMALIDFQGPEAAEEQRARIAREGAGWQVPVPPFDPADEPENLAGLSEEQLIRMRERCTPQPAGCATRPLDRPEALPGLPRSVIACTFTPELVHALAEGGNPAFSAMAGVELHHLPTGHWPMFSRPSDLAALLDEIVAGAADSRPVTGG